MDIFRLTYFNCNITEEDKRKTSERFEIFGSAEAIFNVWFSFKGQEDECKLRNRFFNIPRFVEVFSKEGNKIDMSKGTSEMYSISCDTFK